MDSIVGKYFDFGQALEFLKDGYAVTNDTYNEGFRFRFCPSYITDKLSESEGYFLTNAQYYKNNIFYDLNGEEAIFYKIEEFSLEDVLNERWYLV